MINEQQLSKAIEAAIASALRPQAGAETSANINASAEVTTAKSDLNEEEDFWKKNLHSERIADMQSARTQREEYAKKVFMLVGGWVVGLFILLLAQGLYPRWHPFSDGVLIALISSMTVNLIGTLVIVLKYIFNVRQ